MNMNMKGPIATCLPTAILIRHANWPEKLCCGGVSTVGVYTNWWKLQKGNLLLNIKFMPVHVGGRSGFVLACGLNKLGPSAA